MYHIKHIFLAQIAEFNQLDDSFEIKIYLKYVRLIFETVLNPNNNRKKNMSVIKEKFSFPLFYMHLICSLKNRHSFHCIGKAIV